MKLYSMLFATALLPAFVAPSSQAQNPAPEPQQAETPRDPAETAEFNNARRVTDPVKRADAMEAFVRRFPNSSLKVDALEVAMLAYQQAGNPTKAGESARRVLEIDPQSVRAAWVYVIQARAMGDRSPDDARDVAMQGLLALNAWQQPGDMANEEYAKLHREMTASFTSAIAYYAMMGRDLATARMYYQQSLMVNPMNLDDTYMLGLVELEGQSVDPAGFWYIARAIHLAKTARNGSENFIANYARLKYAQFHGSMEGWAEIVSRVANETTVPDDFTVAQSPTPDN